MRDDDLRDAMRFFAERLRGAEATEAGLRRWTRHKLRNDAQAVAELMLTVGYRATYIRYFLRYHIAHIDPETDGEDVVLAVADLQSAAKRLKQPYRDLAAVCLRWGYVHETVVQLLAKTLERKS
jgi:phosphoglycolate phosphatase-like HAD superfamily hydrolase